MKVKNYLLGYSNLMIYQDTDLFHFSLDSILLARFVTIHPSTKKILDIGCGNAPIPLVLSTRTKASIFGIELQEKSFSLAQMSVLENKLENQITIVHEDVNLWYKNQESDIFDVITCNPPFFKVNEDSLFNQKEEKTLARHEVSLHLEDIFKIARKLLKNNGCIALVHRPERFIEIIKCMRENNIEPKKIQFIYPKQESNANMILIEGNKNGKPGLKVLPPIYAHEENGDYTESLKKYFTKEEDL